MVGRPRPRMGRVRQGRYLYFNNDGDGNAVRDATALRTLLGR